MALDQVKTIYRIIDQQKKFFSSEKSGMSTGAEAAYHLVNDLLTVGAMTMVNVRYTSSSGDTIYSGWPVQERIYKITNAGSGFEVGDKLRLKNGGNGVPLTVQVTSVSRATGAIEGFSVIATDPDGNNIYAEYTDVSATQPNQLDYITEDFTGINDNYFKGQFFLNSRITNSPGTSTSPPVKRTKYIPYNQGVRYPSGTTVTPTAVTTAFNEDIAPGGNIYAAWEANFGVLGSGFYANGVQAPSTRWPTNGIIVLNDADNLPTGATSVFAGQYVNIVDPDTGTVAANTKIKSVTTVQVVTGLTSGGTIRTNWTSIHPSGAGFTTLENSLGLVANETTSTALQIVLDKPITANVGSSFTTKGSGAYINNSNTIMPKKWLAILESTGAIDPMSDTVGVTGNATSTANANIATVTGLTVAGGQYPPTIYVGQSVENVNETGTGVSALTTVVNVAMTSSTTATVTFNKPQPGLSNKFLKFAFDPVQKWRLAVEVQHWQMVNIFAGTEVQLPDTTVIGNLIGTGGTVVDKPGIMGAPLTSGTVQLINENNSNEGFINRKKRTGSTDIDQLGSSPNYPINSQLTVTNRGLFFGVWEGNFSVLQKNNLTNNFEDNVFNWFLIQRPVDRITGRILTTGRAPLFCVNSVGYKYHKFIVRESDVFHPSQGPKIETGNGVTTAYRTPADAHSSDSFAILNTSNQIALTEDSKYLVSFLHNLTTPRFRYSEELDMLGQTSADVCISGNDLSITAYQESGPRIYKALPANKPYNTGLRIVVLKNIP